VILKRAFDIIGSIFGIILFSPIILFIAGLIKLRMPGPIIFKQYRIGRFGKPFLLYKFRTMSEFHDGTSITIKGESRITTFGAKLRKMKLDELPELWNILKGDMSFVGPRPDLPNYIDRLSENERQFLSIRPGLTSPASIKYSNEEKLLASVQDPYYFYDQIIWPDKVNLNLEYYRSRSFSGDILLIIKTLVSLNADKNWIIILAISKYFFLLDH